MIRGMASNSFSAILGALIQPMFNRFTTILHFYASKSHPTL